MRALISPFSRIKDGMNWLAAARLRTSETSRLGNSSFRPSASAAAVWTAPKKERRERTQTRASWAAVVRRVVGQRSPAQGLSNHRRHPARSPPNRTLIPCFSELKRCAASGAAPPSTLVSHAHAQPSTLFCFHFFFLICCAFGLSPSRSIGLHGTSCGQRPATGADRHRSPKDIIRLLLPSPPCPKDARSAATHGS